jgi:hypothetical protein
MWSSARRRRKWLPGSASVDGSLDSEQPTWVLSAMRGKQCITLASGPHPQTRHLAEEIAATMNKMDPEQWDGFIEQRLRSLLDTGQGWG